VVITREARDASGEVHDRMPAFLTPDTLAMLERSSADVAATMREHIVDTKVNNTRTVDPSDASLIEPVAA
jgi:hypothetical protein